MNTPTTYTQDDTICTSVNTLEAPLIGDLKQDEHGEVYVYTGSDWRRVVTPEKQWNDLTHEEKAQIVSAYYPSVYRIIDAAIAAFKEKNQ